jgi:hypothetical protein
MAAYELVKVIEHPLVLMKGIAGDWTMEGLSFVRH